MEKLKIERINGMTEEELNKGCKVDIQLDIDKLNRIYDLEKELGITLEVLFKALKDGIWTNEYEKRDGRKIWLRNYDGKLILEVSNRFCFDVYYPEDYGKTWWLEKPKEELENAKD